MRIAGALQILKYFRAIKYTTGRNRQSTSVPSAGDQYVSQIENTPLWAGPTAGSLNLIAHWLKAAGDVRDQG